MNAQQDSKRLDTAPQSRITARSSAEEILKQSAKDIVANSSQSGFIHNIVKKAGTEAIKHGLSKNSVPDHLAEGIATQFTVAYELLEHGVKLTPAKLSQILVMKGIGIARMGNGSGALTCAISASVAAVSIVKAAAGLLAAAPTMGASLVAAADLVYSLYKANEDCGITPAVQKKIEEKATPILMWLENGIKQAVGYPGMLPG